MFWCPENQFVKDMKIELSRLCGKNPTRFQQVIIYFDTIRFQFLIIAKL